MEVAGVDVPARLDGDIALEHDLLAGADIRAIDRYFGLHHVGGKLAP